MLLAICYCTANQRSSQIKTGNRSCQVLLGESSAGIEWPEFGASFEQDCRAGELAAGQAGGRMLVLEDAPIVISAEGFRNLLFGVFVLYLKPVSKGVVILCAFLSAP